MAEVGFETPCFQFAAAAAMSRGQAFARESSRPTFPHMNPERRRCVIEPPSSSSFMCFFFCSPSVWTTIHYFHALLGSSKIHALAYRISTRAGF